MRRIIEPIIHVILWLSGYLLLLYGANTIGVFSKADDSMFYPLTLGTIINVILFYGVSIYLIPRSSARSKKLYLLFQITILFIVLIAIKSVVGYAFFTAKFSTHQEPFGSQLILNTVTGIVILSLALTYGFTKSWFRNEILKQKLKEEKLSAELNFLKAQINPHFLFNVLNMAYSSATGKGDETTANIIERLSGLMRYMLYDSNSDQVEIGKEIDYIQDYISLQKQRFSKDTSVDIKFETNGEIATNTIAPLILVPFVENAFKHGIKLEKESYIKIKLNISNKKLHFVVENSNYRVHNQIRPEDSGIGLENVKKRLEIIYPHSHQLNISEDERKFLVELQITLQ